MMTHTWLMSESDADEQIKMSYEKPVIIFKHSTTCPISAAAFHAYESFLEEYDRMNNAHEIDFSALKVIESRPVSLYLAKKLGVAHKSPQILLLKDGEVLWHESHWQITKEAIKKALSQLLE